MKSQDTEEIPEKTRSSAIVSVYLILRRNNNILLYLRKNTGYYDNCYGLVSGHVEDGESATAAMAREAYEEAGIEIDPDTLKAVHVMHRLTDRFNIDLFFVCDKWKGRITNQEPKKCAALDFFSFDNLPPNTIPYIQDALKAFAKGNFYSEDGW